MKSLVLLATALLLAVASCTGEKGERGPAGPGSRVVYTGTEKIPTELPFTVNVPEITLNDMPLIGIYIAVELDEVWVELPWYIDGGPDVGTNAYIGEGEVTFQECRGFYYKIVIVK